jgi:hypothetical protein
MSEGVEEISKLESEVMKMFFMFACSINRNRTPDDYFTLLPADPDKPYIELQRLIDGKSYQCYSVKDIERSLNEIIHHTDMYNNLTMNADVPNDRISAKSVFTPDLFNQLGGQNSDILLNTIDISVLSADKVRLHLLKEASAKGYTGITIEKQAETGKYMLTFCNDRSSYEVKETSSEHMIKTIKDEAILKEKAYLDNKTGRKLFTDDEVPKDVLKQAGIKWSDLSETGRQALLEGREASVTITHKFGNRGKKYSRGYLRLSRTGGNKAEFMFRPAPQNMKIGMKM